jgi:hypothetical protein
MSYVGVVCREANVIADVSARNESFSLRMRNGEQVGRMKGVWRKSSAPSLSQSSKPCERVRNSSSSSNNSNHNHTHRHHHHYTRRRRRRGEGNETAAATKKRRPRGAGSQHCGRRQRLGGRKNERDATDTRVGGQQPQFHGVVVATGYQKRRRRVKRQRENETAVPRQSCHTCRRRVVGGQQPQFHDVVVAAGCQKRRRRVKRHRGNRAAVPRQSRHTSLRRVVGGQQPQPHDVVVAAGCQKRRRRVKRQRGNQFAVPLQSRDTDELRKKWRRERTLAPSLSA